MEWVVRICWSPKVYFDETGNTKKRLKVNEMGNTRRETDDSWRDFDPRLARQLAIAYEEDVRHQRHWTWDIRDGRSETSDGSLLTRLLMQNQPGNYCTIMKKTWDIRDIGRETSETSDGSLLTRLLMQSQPGNYCTIMKTWDIRDIRHETWDIRDIRREKSDGSFLTRLLMQSQPCSCCI